MIPSRLFAATAAVAAALAVSGCATRPFTGPVEVTRFVAPGAAGLRQGTIAIVFPDEMTNQGARAAFAQAVGQQLTQLGYTLVPEGTPGSQIATVRTVREALPTVPQIADPRGNVVVGLGGGGGFGGQGFGGAGVGVGVGLGGGRERAAASTQLLVRIADPRGTALWEGRSQIATGIKSPYSELENSARVLATALFRDFPGTNAETLSIRVRNLKPRNVSAQ